MSNVLIFAPHADDEVEGTGASIVKHVENGDSVHVCVLSFRDYQSEVDQMNQAESARKILGYDTISFLGLHDEELDKMSRLIIKPAEKIYDEVVPDIVYVTTKCDTNQDHRAAHEAILTICRYYSNPPKEIRLYDSGSTKPGSFAANTFNVLDERHVLAKVDALNCYEPELHEPPHPRCGTGIFTRAKYWGQFASCFYAEPFITINRIVT